MRMYDIIEKKKTGAELSEEEIRFFLSEYVKGMIPDYQASALLMAIYFQGMSLRETKDLTFAIRDSGERLDFSSIQGIRVDKHSTGGVGDKTSLIVAPIVASQGVKVAKISGRGLGHTGGTIDKLESIPDFDTAISQEEFISNVNKIGISIIRQTKKVAPADKKLYALRDVTATVDSMPLIVSSIMGKKLAADDDCIVLDVKTGSGSFMKTLEESRELASLMVQIGREAGKKMMAVITEMDRPLGEAVGNSLEVIEAIEVLKGRGPADLIEVSFELATDMLMLAGKGTREECEKAVKDSVSSGKALEVLRQMISAQHGNSFVIENYKLFGEAAYEKEIVAKEDGYIFSMNTEGIGKTSLLLGAGRLVMDQRIDPTAGLRLLKKTGDFVKKGDVLAKLYTSRESAFENAEKEFEEAIRISKEKPVLRPLILDRIGEEK